MSLALRLAEQGRYTVSPNPMVGCVIVKDNQIVGRGYHQRAGEPHAEIFALREAKEHARGATAYITLEPCTHQGRTPPCVLSLLQADIKKVVIACKDPNPLVSGKGIEILRSKGVEVELGLCEEEAMRLNTIFFHYITHKKPYVIAKWAMSIDGKTIVNQYDRKQISCNESQKHTHDLRHQVDAILVGAATARIDNPELTIRCFSGEEIHKHPKRIILCGGRPLAKELKIFHAEMPSETILAVSRQGMEWASKLNSNSNSCQILVLPEEDRGHIELSALLNKLGEMEITSLLVEGGQTVHQSFFKQNLVNKLHVYLCPSMIGTFPSKKQMTISQCEKIGCDFHFVAEVNQRESLCLAAL